MVMSQHSLGAEVAVQVLDSWCRRKGKAYPDTMVGGYPLGHETMMCVVTLSHQSGLNDSFLLFMNSMLLWPTVQLSKSAPDPRTLTTAGALCWSTMPEHCAGALMLEHYAGALGWDC